MRTFDRIREKVRAGLRRPERGAVILAYHRIVDVPLDPSGLAVPPALFEAQMECLARRARPVTLERAARATTDPEAGVSGAVAVTFDDGYADNLEVAKPILERLSIPATVFIPSDAVGRETPFWWDSLEALVFGADALPESLDLEIAGNRVTMPIRDDGGRRDLSGRYRGWRVWRGPARTPRQKLYTALWEMLRGMPDAEVRSTLETLAAWAGVAPPGPAHPTLDAAGIRELLSSALTEIGAHSARHPFLPAHPPDVQREEIVEGRRRLEDAAGVRTSAFAYPYGAYDETTVALVREAGFERGVTTAWGAVTPASDPYLLPRLTVGDWDEGPFARRVERFLAR